MQESESRRREVPSALHLREVPEVAGFILSVLEGLGDRHREPEEDQEPRIAEEMVRIRARYGELKRRLDFATSSRTARREFLERVLREAFPEGTRGR